MNTDNIDKLAETIANVGKIAIASYPVPKLFIDEKALNLQANVLAGLNSKIASITQSWTLPITQELEAFSNIANSLKPISINFPTISFPIEKLIPNLNANIQLFSKAISLSGIEILDTFKVNKEFWSSTLDTYSSLPINQDLTLKEIDENVLNIEELSLEEIKDIVDGTHDDSKKYDCLDIPSFISKCETLSLDEDNPDSLVVVADLLNGLAKTTDKSAHNAFWKNFSTALASKLGEHSADIIYLIAVLLVINYFNIKFDAIQKLINLLSNIK